jgi:hypothetical protein
MVDVASSRDSRSEGGQRPKAEARSHLSILVSPTVGPYLISMSNSLNLSSASMLNSFVEPTFMIYILSKHMFILFGCV